MSSFMSIRQGKPGGFAGLFIIKVCDDEVIFLCIGLQWHPKEEISAENLFFGLFTQDVSYDNRMNEY